MKDKMKNLKPEVTAFVISSGYNPNYENCLNALQKQTVEIKIDIIKDYHPMSLAFQQMLKRCETKYYVEVDEDMILYQNAIEQMYTDMEKSDEKLAMFAYQLKDIHINFDIFGVKIYKYNIFKNYSYNLECLSCEVEQLDRLKNDGYSYDCINVILGEHSPQWTHSSIFERYFNLMEKFKEFGYSWLETLPLKLWNILKQNPNEQNLYALLGAYSSILKENISNQEKDFTQVKLPEYGLTESFITLPVSATLYMTSKCNFKCEWCYRQHHSIEEAPDMDILRVNQLFTRFPTITAVCICGFGETFLSLNLRYVIETLHQKNVYIGVITNGSLLEENLPRLYEKEEFLPNYISISLNAHNSEIHKKITKTETFDKVLKGIKKSIDLGMETFVSYVCTKENLKYVSEFLKLVKSLGIKTVYLHNLLPHFDEKENNKFWDLVLQKKDECLLDEIKNLQDSDIVKLYPTLINKNEIRRYCHFPWKSIAIDGNGSISICNSVYPCQLKNGTLDDPLLWQNEYCKNFRASILGEQHPACQKCFRNWEIKPC